MKIERYFLFFLLLLGIVSVLYGQTEEEIETSEPLIHRHIFWSGSEYAFGYDVKVERLENGEYIEYQETLTEEQYIDLYLPQGDYRIRVIPRDFFGRPYEPAGTPWFNFTLHPVVEIAADDSDETSAPDEPELSNIIDLSATESDAEEDDDHYAYIVDPDLDIDLEDEHARELAQAESAQEAAGRNTRFNTLGFSVGTSFADPRLILSLHGTYSFVENFFIELGIDAGFLSTYKDMDSHYSIFPNANLGLFLPFYRRGGFFIGAGFGYMMSHYTNSIGYYSYNVIAGNFYTGINLFDILNITYALRTDFATANSKLSLGIVYRF